MNQLSFNPEDYPPKVLKYIMLKATEWGCSPDKAVVRILTDRLKPKT